MNWLVRLFGGPSKEDKIASAHKRGFNYAMTELSTGRHKPSELEAESMTSSTFHEDAQSKAFDRGILEAINEAIVKGITVDDRDDFGKN